MASLQNFLGLIILLIAVCFFAFIGYVAYTVVNDVTDKTKQKMEKKNINFSKGGMTVKMKERTAEQESDDAQNLLVKAWSHASVSPANQAKPGQAGSASNSAATTPAATPGTEKRWPFSRTPSGRPKA